MLIGLSGFAHVGKTTIARSIVNNSDYWIASFAGELKSDLSRITTDIRSQFPNVTKDDYRPLMVAYGQVMRSLDPDYWIKRLDRVLNCSGRENTYIIDDVRYANEVKYIQDNGGVVIRLWRKDIVPANEEEQRSFNEIDEKYPELKVIFNNGTVEEAAEDVLDYIKAVNL